MLNLPIAPPAHEDRGPNVWTFARSLIWVLLLITVGLWGLLIISG